MRQGYFGFHLEASSVDDLGGSYFGVSDFSLPLPFFLPFEALSFVVDWMALAWKVYQDLMGFSKED